MSRVHAKFRAMVSGNPAEAAATDGDHGHHGGHHDGPHIVPVWLLAVVLIILLALTVFTVAVTLVDLGTFNIIVALGIAVIKSAFVVLYFMHLRWDSPFNSVVLMAALVFIGVFLAFALVDSSEYRPAVDAAVSTTK